MSFKSSLNGLKQINSDVINTTDFNVSNLNIKRFTTSTISSSIGNTLTPLQIAGGLIDRITGTAASTINDYVPTATTLINTLGLTTGDSLNFQINANNTGNSGVLYLLVNTGSTYKTNSSSVANAASKATNMYRIIITSSTTYDIYRTSNLAMV